MNRSFRAVLSGVAAGLISFVIQSIEGVGWHCRMATYIQWIIVSLLIFNFQAKIEGWVKGLVVSGFCVLPLLLLLPYFDSATSVITLALMFGLIGSIIGAFSEKQ